MGISAFKNAIQMTVLVVDDDAKLRSSICKFLRARGHRTHEAGNGSEALGLLRQHDFDIVITDIKMPGMDGFELLREVRCLSPDTEVIMITGYKDLENAFRAMRGGAFDFFTKPFKVEELNASLQRTVRFQTLQREKTRVQERLDRIGEEASRRYGIEAIVGASPAVGQMKDLIEQVFSTDATTVLVTGETGTGKELVARAIHYESARAGGPFVPVDCSAVPETLLESQFYGQVKGAFTDAREARKGLFEQAGGAPALGSPYPTPSSRTTTAGSRAIAG